MVLRRKRLLSLGLSLSLLVGLMVAELSSASPTIGASFYLDSYNANNSSGGNSITAPIVLSSSKTYTVTVTGTYSAWEDWPYRRCGKPDPSPVYHSPSADHQAVTAVGDDAVFRFAKPLYTGTCHGRVFPYATHLFQVNLGNGWKRFVPDGGVPSKPTANRHQYTETVAGRGVAPKFRIVDWRPSDNNGQLLINISEARVM